MNNKIWITNHFKQIEATKRYWELDRLRSILILIKSEKEQRMIYRKKENR